MKSVLVTGGAGFIGTNLCSYLVSLGYFVYCIDNFSSGKYSNLSNIIDHPNFHVIREDVLHFSSPQFLEKIDFKFDQIYHLACPASPPIYQSNRINTIKVAFIGTMNMVEFANSFGSRILVASTSEVYGDPNESPQKENYWGNVNPVGPRSCYDEGKRAAESFTMDMIRDFKTDARIARIFNTYGRYHYNDGRLVPNLISNVLKKTPIKIYGDGTQTRSLCHVDDTVYALYKLMEHDDVSDFPVFNIGNPKEYTVCDIADKIFDISGENPGVKFEPPLEDDPFQRKPDISRAKLILRWKPEIELNDGLKQTFDWAKRSF